MRRAPRWLPQLLVGFPCCAFDAILQQLAIFTNAPDRYAGKAERLLIGCETEAAVVFSGYAPQRGNTAPALVLEGLHHFELEVMDLLQKTAHPGDEILFAANLDAAGGDDEVIHDEVCGCVGVLCLP